MIQNNNHNDIFVRSKIKESSFKKNILKAQNTLPKSHRLIARIINNSSVEQVINFLSYIIRPRAIIVGGTLATITTIATLVIYIDHGYEYNYFLPLFVFFLGYVLTCIYEIIRNYLTKYRRYL